MPSEATPHRRGAFRLVALVVFEVFANFVVNALIKDLPTSNSQRPTSNTLEVGRWRMYQIGGYEAGTNARNRRGLSMVIRRSISSVTPALRSFGANTVSVIPYPGRASLRAVKL